MAKTSSDPYVKQELQNLIEVVKDNSKSTKRITIIAILISTIAMVFSCISLIYSMKDDINDAKWMEVQSNKFQEMIDSQNRCTEQIAKSMDSLIVTSESYSNYMNDTNSKIENKNALQHAVKEH